MGIHHRDPPQKTRPFHDCVFKSPWSHGFPGSNGINYFFFFQLLLKISFHFGGGREKPTEELEECSVNVCSLSSGIHRKHEV